MNRFNLHPDFEMKLYKKYPQQSIEDGLILHGISPVDLGYHKIYWLKVKFDSYEGKDTTRSVQRGRKSGFDILTVEKYQKHPYIEFITQEKVGVSPIFYRDAYILKNLAIGEILDIFEISPDLFTHKTKSEMSAKLLQWKPNELSETTEIPMNSQI